MDGNKDFLAVVLTVVGVLGFVGFFQFFGDELGVHSGPSAVDVVMSPVELGKRIVRNCTPCHDLTSTRRLTRVGPPLWEVVGRPVASVPEYKFSRALLQVGQQGGVWDEPSLDQYLADPKEFVPGNKMAFAGLHDAAERRALIEYLKTLISPKENLVAPLIDQAILSLSADEDGSSFDERVKRGRIESEKCGACHDLSSEKKVIIGPFLMGVVGRPAGRVVGFDFSQPFMEAVAQGLEVWNTKNLDQFLTDPKAMISGTKMVCVGIKDQQRRKDLITYLKTLK
ncbi:MAG: hypothetical protein HQL75_18230 [Magnetococcales bacterium]|nr:hypothetical protein [Magnetococcales bacterium]